MFKTKHKHDAIFSKLTFFCSQYYFWVLAIILSVSYFCFGTYRNWPYKIESDGKYYYQYLVSVMFDKDIDFTNNYRAEKYEWMKTEIDHYKFRENINPITEKPLNVFTIGPAILWFPFFIIATSIGNILTVVNLSVDLNPYGKFFQYTVMYSGVVYCLAGLVLLYRLLTQMFQESISKIVVWLILIATPLYYYTIFEVSTSHVYDYFTFTLLLYMFASVSKNNQFSYFAILGFIAALHVLIRTQNILTVFVFSVLLFFEDRGKLAFLDRVFLGKIGVYAITFVIGLFPLVLTNTYLYGHPLTIPQGSEFLRWSDPQILSLLFSARNGLFSHHPMLILGLFGYIGLLVKSFRDTQRFPLFFVLLIAILLQVYINSTVADWWAGHSYGQRRLVFSLPLFAFGLGFLLQRIQTNFSQYAQKIIIPMFLVCTVMGIYLTLIHVFLWDYDQPHNIVKWMFYYAPLKVFK